jgi:hypothetical protein
MSTTENKTLEFENGVAVALPFRAREIRRIADLVLVLLDPDHYLNDDSFRAAQSPGAPAFQNLIAFDRLGNPAWAAELPEAVDYYYSIGEGLPIRALSYSGHRCVIDAIDGRIMEREFLK